MIAGTQVGQNRIVRLLGTGGMGEVYAAEDTRLHRLIALKILRPELAVDPSYRERFRREAQAAAALNHPNIVTLHSVEDSDGILFLTMELVEGTLLRELIPRKGLDLHVLLRTATQLASAVAAAQERGVTHRDLKPSNVIVTPDGVAKVLDFGLAKLHELEAAVAPDTSTVTLRELTGARIIGSVAYMSPEQAQGKSVDSRSDIFSLGVVLHEMATGDRPFKGDSDLALMAAIVRDMPKPLTDLRPELPTALAAIVRRCLAKDPTRRYQSAADLRNDLEELEETIASGAAPLSAVPVRGGSRRWPTLMLLGTGVAAVAVLGVITSVVGTGSSRHSITPSTSEMRVEMITPATTDPLSLAVSPDGRRIAFVATYHGRPHLWLRPLNEIESRPLAGTDLAAEPFWSPDGRTIGFFADHKLKRIDIADGTVQVLARIEVGLGGSWSQDGRTILFSGRAAGPIFSIPAAGGTVATLTSVHAPQLGHRFPCVLPDGQHFLYYVAGPPQTSAVWVARLNGSESRQLLSSDSAAISWSGHLLFVRQGTLYAERFDPATLTVDNALSVVASRVALESRLGRPALAASTDGPLLYREMSAVQRQFVWFDRMGRPAGTVGERGQFELLWPSLSPDDRYLAIVRSLAGNSDVWLLDATRGALTRVTSDPGNDTFPVWAADGKRIVFSSQRQGHLGSSLYVKSIDGTEEEVLFAPEAAGLASAMPDDWSPDQRFVMFRDVSAAGGYDLWAVRLEPGARPFPVVKTQFEEGGAQFSPDGKWFAYQSDESGRSEVYVRPFRGPGAKIQISTEGGTQARWSRTSRELFYVALDGHLMAVPIRSASTGASFDAGKPFPLFATGPVAGLPGQGNYRQQYMVSRDGQRFLVDAVVQEDASPIIAVFNWKPH